MQMRKEQRLNAIKEAEQSLHELQRNTSPAHKADHFLAKLALWNQNTKWTQILALTATGYLQRDQIVTWLTNESKSTLARSV